MSLYTSDEWADIAGLAVASAALTLPLYFAGSEVFWFLAMCIAAVFVIPGVIYTWGRPWEDTQ